MAAPKPTPPPTPESILADIHTTGKVLTWMDRFRWPASLLPVVLVGGMVAYYEGFVRRNAPGLELAWGQGLAVACAAGAVCFVAFTLLSRYLRRALDKVKADLFAKVPSLRPPDDRPK